jgi:hypothetical protein
MNSISKIKSAFETIKTELSELEKEAPGISFYVWHECRNKTPHQLENELTAALNAARLRNIALSKLTQQDREALWL